MGNNCYFENHAEQIHTYIHKLCSQNTGFLNMSLGGTYYA